MGKNKLTCVNDDLWLILHTSSFRMAANHVTGKLSVILVTEMWNREFICVKVHFVFFL